MTMQNLKIKIALIFILLSAFVLMVFAARADSLVVDEKVHIPAGYLHFWQGDYTFNTEHPPLLNDLAGLFAKIGQPNLPATPLTAFHQGEDQWSYGDLFFYKSGNDMDKVVFWARFPFILLTLGLIYLVFLWAKTLFGPKAGLLAATLTAFSPNILAHGHLATTDIGVAFFFLLASWFLRKYYHNINLKNAVWVGIAVGLLILAKFSGLVILPLLLLIIVLALFKGKTKTVLAHFGMMILLAVVLVWSVYAFSMRADLVKGIPLRADFSRTIHYQTLAKSPALKVFLGRRSRIDEIKYGIR